jgi:hypothetical protein
MYIQDQIDFCLDELENLLEYEPDSPDIYYYERKLDRLIQEQQNRNSEEE